MKWKLIINIVTFIALGLIIYFARHDIADVVRRLSELDLWVLALMIPAQFLVFFTYAKIFHHTFKITGKDVSTRQLFGPSIELNFVNHIFPSAGVSGFSYLTLRLKEYGTSTAKSTLAQLARFAFMFISFIALLLVALILLAAEGRTSSLVVLAVSAVTFSMVFATAVLIFVIGSESRIRRFSNALARWLNRLIHMFHRRNPETISLARVEKTFRELHEDYVLIRGNMSCLRQVLVWSILAALAELLLLYLAFVAHGEWVNPGTIIIAFVIASVAGLFAILPGGLGIYEPLMTAVLISGGVPPALALSATLVYRVITLLLSLVTGYVLYQRTIHRHGHGTTDLSSQ
jgi:putative heme transporter